MSRLVDLTLTIRPGMRGVDIRPKMRLERDGWNGSTLELYSHSGTHMDAPRHFLGGPVGIDQQDLHDCLGPARVIDLTPVEPRKLIDVERLGRDAGQLTRGSRILLRTDWSHRHGSDAYRDELPRISRDLAELMVERGVALLGVEPPSVADVNNLAEVTEVHRILLGGGVTIVEGLCRLDELPSTVDVAILPLKVEGCDGAPVRAIATIPDE